MSTHHKNTAPLFIWTSHFVHVVLAQESQLNLARLWKLHKTHFFTALVISSKTNIIGVYYCMLLKKMQWQHPGLK